MDEVELIRKTFDLARKSLSNGNLPFGCLLADNEGHVLEEGLNSVITDKDAIAHCEINLVHQLAGRYEPDFLKTCTLYASTEPCPMCTGAIYWSGIGRVVFAMSKNSYHEVAGTTEPAYIFNMSATDLLNKGGRTIKVEGPLLEEEARQFYLSL